MKTKIFFLLLLPSITFAIDEIPLVTISKPTENINYKNLSLLKTEATSQIISSKDIETSGTKTLSNLLNSVDGIQTLDPSGSGRTVISMRGFADNATSNTLILLNGQPYTNPDMSAPILNLVPLQDIEQIEITPGSSSILYGEQAVGGIVNIITKVPQKNSSSASFGGGNFKTYQAQFNLTRVKRKQDLSYQLGGSFYSTNNYRDNNAERINNISVGLNYKKLYLRYRKINQHLELPGPLSKKEASQNPRQAKNSSDFNNQDHDLIQLGLKYNLSPNWQTSIDSDTKLMRGYGVFSSPFDERRETVSLRPKISGIINLKKQSILPIFGVDLSYGKYKKHSHKESMYNFPTSYNHIQKQKSFYSQITLPFTTTLAATLGGRYSKAFYKLSGRNKRKPINEAFITSVGLKWQAQNNLSFFIRRAESYRFPKVDEITFTHDNKLLKTQTGVSYETGLEYKKKIFTGSLTAYQLDLKNEIIGAPKSILNNEFRNKNLDPTRRRGLIANLDIEATKYLQLKGNYNFVDPTFSKGELKGNDIPFVARDTLRISTILKPKKNLQFLLEGIYTGNRYQINDFQNRLGKVAGFKTYNSAITYKKSIYTFSLRGNNLTNKLYYNYVAYNGYYPGSGISILGTMGIEL